MTIDRMLEAAKVYESVSPAYGAIKKLVCTVLCDGMQMSISSDAVGADKFVEKEQREELRKKVHSFLSVRQGKKMEIS